MELNDRPKAWYRELNGYHWLVLSLCTLGWTFDCLDQQLFALSRSPAIAELKALPESAGEVTYIAGWATSLMLIGWATGGIIFGICGDKFGRVKTLIWTVTMYAVFTGLCGVAQSVFQFMLFRFLTGLGVGGAFGSCATLVAETMPDRARPHALGFLQAIAAVGNISAAFITLGLGELVHREILPWGWQTWRWSFLIGVFPLLLVPLVARYLHEPEAWHRAHQEAKQGGRKIGSMFELFGQSDLRNRAILGMLLAMVGVIGFWGIMLFAIDLNRSVARKECQRAFAARSTSPDRQFLVAASADPQWLAKAAELGVKADFFLPLAAEDGKAAFSPQQVFAAMEQNVKDGAKTDAAALAATIDGKAPGLEAELAAWLSQEPKPGILDTIVDELKDRKASIDKESGRLGSLTSILINLGGFFGVYSFTFVTSRIGRRETFSIFLTAAFLSTLAVFLLADQIWKIYVFVPMMGFSLLSLMGGYTIYFPELFPTRLRSTSVSFCYNVGRYVAAIGPGLFGFLTAYFKAAGFAEPIRYAGASLCPIFLLGILIIWCMPETRGKKLPE